MLPPRFGNQPPPSGPDKRDDERDEGAVATQEEVSLRKQYADWPQKGDERAQPWDFDALGIKAEVAKLNEQPGAKNTVTPVVIRHSYPILASGSGHPTIVADLGQRLADLGYANSVSDGENPLGHVDESILNAVDNFRRDYGVEEDPTPFGGNNTAGQIRAALHIGPYTWEAVIRASDRQRAEDEEG